VLALFALVVFALGWLLPGRIARGVLARLRKPAAAPAPAVLFQASLLPFIVRISLFEMTTVLGFVIGMRTGVVAAALPFAAAGLAATLLSPPTPAFLTGLFGDANLAPSHSS
jgi:hypothetical protein